MSALELYVKFMFTLSVGLVGVGMVLKTLLEALFAEWDAVRAVQRAWYFYFHSRPHAALVRAEDILMELERDHVERLKSESSTLDIRRAALRDMREAEVRLKVPQASEVV
ncbi:MAG: hypothetical protein AAB036_08705 [Elusimicrobiota bacterium]